MDVAGRVSKPIYNWHEVADPTPRSADQTIVLLTYTPENIYVAFDGKGKLKADSLTFLFSAEDEEVSHYNIAAEGRVTGPGSQQCGVKATDEGWSGEMRIPAGDLGFAPEKGKTVWVNFKASAGRFLSE